MSRLIGLALLSALVLISPPEASGQLVLGEASSRTRVLLRDGVTNREWLIGTVLSTGPDTVMFEIARTGERRALARGEIERMEVSVGRTDRRKYVAGIGASAGLLAGVAVGLQAGKRSCRTEYAPFPGAGPIPYETCSRDWSFGNVAAGALGGGLLGYLLGLAVGEGMSSERWQDVTASTQLQPWSATAVASLSIAW